MSETAKKENRAEYHRRFLRWKSREENQEYRSFWYHIKENKF